jgi:hypothetical protein
MNVFSDAGVRGQNPSLVGGTGTVAKLFPNLLANSTGLPAGFGSGSPAPTAPLAPANLLLPGTGQFEQKIVEVRAAGYVFVHGTSPTVNFVFQEGTSLTATSNTTMATMASAASLTTAAFYPWAFKAFLQSDAKSGVMQIFNAFFSLNGASQSLTLTDLTGVNLLTTNYNFVAGVTFAVSDALNVGALGLFQMGE